MIMQRKLSKNKRKHSELQSFKEPDCTFSQLFMQARHYPQFFHDNLVDDDRTIKLFYNQPYAHQTIFYFQLLKLTFEAQDADYEKYLAKIYELLDNPEFQFALPGEQNYYHLELPESRMRRMMEQFLEELGEGNSTVSEIISKYPVIDKIMVLFLRTLLLAAGKCESFDDFIEPVEIYEFLAEYFEIEITYFTNCLKFNQTDLFVYFQAENEIYLAYISPKNTQEHILSSEELYHLDPQEAFNISSVKQMISEIELPMEEEECFALSKYNQSLNQTEFFQYEYSRTQDVRQLSKSIHENSEFKFSSLMNDDSSVLQSIKAIKSNKVLERENTPEKKLNSFVRVNWKNIDCFEIKQAPLQLQNAVSPAATPKSRLQSFGKGDNPFKKHNYNIYQKRLKQNPRVSDEIKEQNQLFSTGQSEGFYYNKQQKENSTWEALKKQTEMVLGSGEFAQPPPKLQKTIKSLYEMRSIKSINSCNDGQSYVLETPIKTSFSTSRKQTQGAAGSTGAAKRNEYTRHGYINNNISTQFTNSMILKELKDPFKSKIQSIKMRARNERRNIQNMMCF